MKRFISVLLCVTLIFFAFGGCYDSSDLEDASSAGYANGYEAGKEEGREFGYEDGLNEGRELGYEDGYQEAQDEYEDSYKEGYADGKIDGYGGGYSEGKQEVYDQYRGSPEEYDECMASLVELLDFYDEYWRDHYGASCSFLLPEREPTASAFPAPTVPPAAKMVWIPTHGGKKYHRASDCSGMRDPEQVTLEEAENMGYDPCGKCY